MIIEVAIRSIGGILACGVSYFVLTYATIIELPDVVNASLAIAIGLLTALFGRKVFSFFYGLFYDL
jgi:hypothetical protein